MTIPLIFLFMHWIGDFFLQTDWMAINKSKRWDALALHAAVYAMCFLWWGLAFALLTFALHGATDAFTSRITARLWAAGERHWFFVVIGLDQLIHYYTLAWSFSWVSS